MSVWRCRGCGGWLWVGRACTTCDIMLHDEMLKAFHERIAHKQWQQETAEGRRDYLAKLR